MSYKNKNKTYRRRHRRRGGYSSTPTRSFNKNSLKDISIGPRVVRNPYLDIDLMNASQHFSTEPNKQFMNSHQITKPITEPTSTRMHKNNHQNNNEQEFIEQSLSIKVKPQNKKYLTKREIHSKYPREKYRRRKGESKKHIIHLPHRKLLLSQIEFLNNQTRNTNPGTYGHKLVVYAGAAPGNHIPLLIEMFADIIIHLWDHKPFCIAVKNSERVVIRQEYFTEKVAQEYGTLGRDILFISNRTTFDETKYCDDMIQHERSVLKDNELQSKWIKCISCNGHLSAAMMNFRLPYPTLVQIPYEHTFLDGILKMMVWAPATATDTMLHIKPDKNGILKEKIYSCKIYEEQLFWFNVQARQSYIDNEKYYSAQHGVINSYDCWAECLILEQYLLYYKEFKSITKEDVIGMVDSITTFFGDGCFDVEQKEDVLGILDCSYNVNDTKHQGIMSIDIDESRKMIQEAKQCEDGLNIMDTMVDIKCVNSGKICKYEWSVLPCYNLPIYNFIFMGNNIHLIPLYGDVSFKVNPVYSSFYHKCLGTKPSYCCLTGFLIDNNANKRTVRYELSIIDILLPNSVKDYDKRKERIKGIINNYEKYKHTVAECAVFKFIPVKLTQCPSASGGEQNIQSFRNKIQTNIALDDGELIAKTDNQIMKWSDLYFDRKKSKDAPKGWYFKSIEFNCRIGGVLWMKNTVRNILFSDETSVGVDVIDIDVLL